MPRDHPRTHQRHSLRQTCSAVRGAVGAKKNLGGLVTLERLRMAAFAAMAIAFALPTPVSAQQTLALPADLMPHVRDGRFEPGDYEWLHGAFRGASTAQIATNERILEWRRRCRLKGLAETRAELERLGVSAGASLDSMPYRSSVCDQVATLPEGVDFSDWPRFASDVRATNAMSEGFLRAIDLSEKLGLASSSDLSVALTARMLTEQTLRAGLVWATGSDVSVGSSTVLTPQQRGIVSARLAVRLRQEDQDNTTWLKTVIDRDGWPRRSKVGANAAKSAWLLVQHADADPAFQIHALRLMEPLVAVGEVDHRDYAFLYDRVTLKISGRQRYATQLTCRGGALMPMPLEDASAVDRKRKLVGLGSLADYQKETLDEIGPCPADHAR